MNRRFSCWRTYFKVTTIIKVAWIEHVLNQYSIKKPINYHD